MSLETLESVAERAGAGSQFHAELLFLRLEKLFRSLDESFIDNIIRCAIGILLTHIHSSEFLKQKESRVRFSFISKHNANRTIPVLCWYTRHTSDK